jgi:hypothetical protein
MQVSVPWVFVAGYLAGVGMQHAIPIRPYFSVRTPPVLSVSRTVLFGVGAVIAGWGLVLFHKARTTTVPGKASKTLVTRGPIPLYKFVSENPNVVSVGERGMLTSVGAGNTSVTGTYTFHGQTLQVSLPVSVRVPTSGGLIPTPP